jgi:hypothetical protein
MMFSHHARRQGVSDLYAGQRSAADLNLDAINFVGMTCDIGTEGSERTELGKMAEKDPEASKAKAAAYSQRYHRVSDETVRAGICPA